MSMELRLAVGQLFQGKKLQGEDPSKVMTFSITDVRQTKIDKKMQPVFRLTCHDNDKFSKKDVSIDIVDVGIDNFKSKCCLCIYFICLVY